MRTVLKILLIPAAIGLGAPSASAAPANVAVPGSTAAADRADQNVTEVRHSRKHWRKQRRHWRKHSRRGWRHWQRHHSYRAYRPYYYYPGYYAPYYRPYYGPRFSFGFSF